MSVTYLMLVHSDPAHFHRLIRRLGDTTIVVHLDAKADKAAFETDRPNVFWVDERIDIRWGGVSMVQATLLLLRKALAICAQRNTASSHYVLLSGSCYPLLGPEAMAAFFEQHTGRNFIRMSPAGASPFHLRNLKYTWLYEQLPVGNRKWSGLIRLLRGVGLLIGKRWPRSFKRLHDLHLTPYYGSQWWALTHDAAYYVVSYDQEHPQFRQFLKYSLAPDEYFFHTVIGNSPLMQAENQVPWEGDGVYRLANLHVIDPALSRWYSLKDVNQVLRSARLFVRKVSTDHSTPLLDVIDAAMDGSPSIVAAPIKQVRL